MMENERPNNNVNQQLHQYIYQMQMEVGCSGKTLHQVITEYLVLKGQHSELAQRLDELELHDADQTSAERFQKNHEMLARLKLLQTQVYQSHPQSSEHPWKGFAHPDHKSDETESFLRAIRFVFIQLSKFWVEVQSFPLFLNGLNRVSISEIDSIFQWLQSCPSWKESIVQPRVIPALTVPESRKVLFEFLRNVKSARALQEKIASQQSSELLSPDMYATASALLSEGVELTQRYDLGTCVRSDLASKIEETQRRIEEIREIQKFFSRLTEETGFAQVRRLREARQLFHTVGCVRSIPRLILPWRQPRILAPSQLIRIQAWQDRARPVLEVRKKLESYFRLDHPLSSEKIRELAGHLTTGGPFRSFKSSYREALKTYRSLIRPDVLSQKGVRELPLQMAERLQEWASYLDQVQAFDTNPELLAIFGSLFKGIDTEFSLAVEANIWAAQVRSQLEVSEGTFSQALAEAIFTASEERLQKLVLICDEEESRVQDILIGNPVFSLDRDFAELAHQEDLKFADLNRLMNTIVRLGIHPDVHLMSLENLRLMFGEVIFLTDQMESNADLKQWMRNSYRGTDTDLSIIEQSLLYVQFMENSNLPASLKAAFLSVHGPQRLEETRSLMMMACPSLVTLKDHLEKLNGITHGQVKDVVHEPIPELLVKIQYALKQPVLLPGWVEYLKCERDLKNQGLGAFFEFVEAKGIQESPFELMYEIVHLASLLKKVIGNSVLSLADQMNSILVH